MSSTANQDPHVARVRALRERLGALEDLAVAFSGGVDSAVLLHAARSVLGDRSVGLIADSPSLPRRELAEARSLAESLGARLVVLATDELAEPGYRANDGQRCYFCKRALFDAMARWARLHGGRWLAFGEITDDLLDERPGARAAAEGGVLAPLREAGFSKEDVRRYAREHGLAVADKPASACLASRLPRGTAVSAERLRRVERAEEAVRALGFRVLRVRDHGPRARLELGPGELERGRGLAGALARALAPCGFDELELAPYVSPAERALGAGRSAARPAGPSTGR